MGVEKKRLMFRNAVSVEDAFPRPVGLGNASSTDTAVEFPAAEISPSKPQKL